ncbi:hypothetical protein NSZ01_20250 [Nocardioides szechwanensis]|uniref:Uncharacterized protein n=1 Tax=Nocardioides szechwanensis TaxID=1005944 RepID=A0A1H0HCX3_9ACTN|nr:hypothetical protein [Nocardioides szechwanensis]GEP34257.1 hypothetical protein NSZ01_20250 [Nocardioides szechwanensis]SDO16943.1 hypothetical protein SAMN05192576_3540 [Nocardioides szechwanensis]
MATEIEETLARELSEVADGVLVPPMPSLTSADEPRRVVRPWQPLLAAAVVALVVGVVAVLVGRNGGGEPEPAPSPSPSVTDPAVPVTAPTVPYVIDNRLYVDGTQVPGEWWGLETRHGVWLATQFDGSWWWGGPGIEGAVRIEAQIDQGPAISPNGLYIALVDLSSGEARLTGFDTQPAGEGFGEAPIPDLPAREDGVALRVAAVTDEGDVIVQGTRTRLMWRAQFEDQRTVIDLTESAPDQVVLGATPAGLVVVDGGDGATDATSTAPYLATIDGDGRLTPGATLPTYDVLDLSPGGTWLVRAPAGTVAGEVTAVGALSAQAVGSDDEVVLEAPEGWGFAVSTWTWEDEKTLVATLVSDGQGGAARLVRCDVRRADCVAFPVPATE